MKNTGLVMLVLALLAVSANAFNSTQAFGLGECLLQNERDPRVMIDWTRDCYGTYIHLGKVYPSAFRALYHFIQCTHVTLEHNPPTNLAPNNSSSSSSSSSSCVSTAWPDSCSGHPSLCSDRAPACEMCLSVFLDQSYYLCDC
jgi:hypothetical protein